MFSFSARHEENWKTLMRTDKGYKACSLFLGKRSFFCPKCCSWKKHKSTPKRAQIIFGFKWETTFLVTLGWHPLAGSSNTFPTVEGLWVPLSELNMLCLFIQRNSIHVFYRSRRLSFEAAWERMSCGEYQATWTNMSTVLRVSPRELSWDGRWRSHRFLL